MREIDLNKLREHLGTITNKEIADNLHNAIEYINETYSEKFKILVNNEHPLGKLNTKEFIKEMR